MLIFVDISRGSLEKYEILVFRLKTNSPTPCARARARELIAKVLSYTKLPLVWLKAGQVNNSKYSQSNKT